MGLPANAKGLKKPVGAPAVMQTVTMASCGQLNAVFEVTSGFRQRVLVATVSDHDKAYKAGVKAGGVLVSVDGDRDFTGHSSVEVRAWNAQHPPAAPLPALSLRVVWEDSNAVVDEGCFNRLTPART